MREKIACPFENTILFFAHRYEKRSEKKQTTFHSGSMHYMFILL